MFECALTVFNNYFHPPRIMNTTELLEALREKNILLLRQSRRIELLETKMTELRKKFFQLKYIDVVLPVPSFR